MSKPLETGTFTELLKAHISQEYTAATTSFPFQAAKRKFNWHTATTDPFQRIQYSYENKLLDIFRNSARGHGLHENRPIAIIGGRGGGKTTSVIRALELLKAEDSITYIRIDMNRWDDRQFSDLNEHELQNRFASHLSEKIVSHFPTKISLEQDVFEFFPWCINERSFTANILAHIEPFSKFLRIYSAEIEQLCLGKGLGNTTYDDLHHQILAARQEFLKAFSEIDFIWYSLLQMIYLSEWEPDREKLAKHFLVLDNIDPVNPKLQRFAIRIFHRITLASGIQTIIPMRPHTETVSAASAGADWYSVEAHCSPDIVEVVLGRLDAVCTSDDGKPYQSHVETLKTALGKDQKHLREILINTSALDIRTGLLNFSNFCERIVSAKGLSFDFKIDQSELCRFFFLGERNRFNYSFAENLFLYDAGEDQVFSHCKIYALDYLLRVSNGGASCGSVTNHLERFGFTPQEIECSLGNLLRRSRALVWSNDGFEYAELKAESEMRVTPLAFTYFFRLFGEYYYTEACMMDRRFQTASVREVLDFEREVVRRDLRAMLHFVDREDAHRLNDYFPNIDEVAGIRHWKRFVTGAKFRLKADNDRLVDSNRLDWLRSIYQKVFDGRATDLDEVQEIVEGRGERLQF